MNDIDEGYNGVCVYRLSFLRESNVLLIRIWLQPAERDDARLESAKPHNCCGASRLLDGLNTGFAASFLWTRPSNQTPSHDEDASKGRDLSQT